MKKALYRTRQYIFSLFVGLVQNKTTKLIKGENSILEVINLLKEKNINKIFIVTTNGFIKRGTLNQLFEKLNEENINHIEYTNVSPDPTVSNVEDGVKAYNEFKAEAIIAIGGGSVLDCAKVIGARITNPKRNVRDLKGMLKVKNKIPYYIPVPATCGTGSEVTAAAVITDNINNMNYKYAVTDLKLIPEVAILDPLMLKTLPKSMLLTTSMDALTHSLEAYLNLFASKSVKNDSMESVKLIFNNLEKAYNDYDNDSLNNLLYASTLGGIAITHNFVGYVHAIAHALGAIYHLPHGYLNSIILPVILKEYGNKIEKKMKNLCSYLNINTNSSCVDLIIDKIYKLTELDNIPKYIKELKESDFDEIVKRANKEANPTYPVPKILSKKQLKNILYKLMEK